MQVLQQNMPVTNRRHGQGIAIHILAPQLIVGLHSTTAQHSSAWYTGCHGLQCILQIEEIKLCYMFNGWTSITVQQLKTRTVNGMEEEKALLPEKHICSKNLCNFKISRYSTLPSIQTKRLSRLFCIELTLGNNCSSQVN